jgi:hypothetical protein
MNTTAEQSAECHDSAERTLPGGYAKLTRFVRAGAEELLNWYRKNRTIFWATYAVTLIAYSYLFTSVAFTNHAFPQSWTFSYPSYRTLSEGRWFEDLLLQSFGGAGVQSSQMYVAVGLYIVITIIAAGMLGAEGTLETFLSVAFLNIYPTVLDRYSFPGSQIVFVTADIFAVLAVLVLHRQKATWKALAMAAPLFVLCFATYQPSIALAAFLVLAYCVSLVLRPDAKDVGSSGIFPIGRLATAAAAMSLGMVIYFVTAKMTVRPDTSFALQRTHVNSISEVITQLLAAFPAFVKYFTTGSDYLPQWLRWMPFTVIMAGAASLISLAWRRGLSSFLAVICFLGLMPVALRAAYIINSQTFTNLGRLLNPYAYALLFFLLATRTIKILKIPRYLTLVLLTYFCMIVATQETNKAYFKMIFDTNKINRIVSRIENVVPDLYAKKHSVVIIGNLSMNDKNYKSYPNKSNSSGINHETFVDFRHTQFLNFYLGQDVLVLPTAEQRDAAIASATGRRPWPAPESVYVKADTVVVLLEAYRSGLSVTRARYSGALPANSIRR